MSERKYTDDGKYEVFDTKEKVVRRAHRGDCFIANFAGDLGYGFCRKVGGGCVGLIPDPVLSEMEGLGWLSRDRFSNYEPTDRIPWAMIVMNISTPGVAR